VDELLARGLRAEEPETTRRQQLCDSVAGVLRKRTKRFRKVGPGLWDVADRGQEGVEGVAAR